MNLREKIAEELWNGSNLPEPRNKDGVRLDWVKRYRKQSNVWVRGFWDGERFQVFRIKWKTKTCEFVSAGLMDFQLHLQG